MSVNAWVLVVMGASILFVTGLIGAVRICLGLILDERVERTPY